MGTSPVHSPMRLDALLEERAEGSTDVVVFDWEKEEKHKESTTKTTKEDAARILERFGDA